MNLNLLFYCILHLYNAIRYFLSSSLYPRCKYGIRAKLLIQHNANVMITNNKKEYPLHRACCNDNNMEVCLKHAASCNMFTIISFLSLFLLSSSSLPSLSRPPFLSLSSFLFQVVLYLSDLVPDINTQDADGWTALMYAARSNCPSVLKYLLQRKADPNLQQVL